MSGTGLDSTISGMVHVLVKIIGESSLRNKIIDWYIRTSDVGLHACTMSIFINSVKPQAESLKFCMGT